MYKVNMRWERNTFPNIRRFYVKNEQEIIDCLRKNNVPDNTRITIDYGSFIIKNMGHRQNFWATRDDFIDGVIARADDLPTMFKLIDDYKKETR